MFHRHRRETGGLLALSGLLSLVLSLGGAGNAPGAATRRTTDRELLILTTTSNRGEVDPCG